MAQAVTTLPGENTHVNIFLSYSSEDIELKKSLLTQLKVLTISDKHINIWDDGLLQAGDQWNKKIKEKLHSAHIVLMLISANFLTTDYILNIEVQNTLERLKNDEVSALPIILSPCAWMQTPLSQFQALPRKGKPVTDYPDRNTAFFEIVTGIQQVINNWKLKLGLI